MRKIWSTVNNMKIGSSNKIRLFLFILAAICGVCGFLIWVTIGRLLLPGIVWLICFAGYPAVFIGIIGGAFYLFNHEF